MEESTKSKEEEWAKSQIEKYKSIHGRYQKYANMLQVVLEKAAKKYAPLAIVQTRPKSVASFGEKIQRKKNKYRDPVNQITDLCGARVILPTLAEVRAVCEFIERHFDIDWENTIDVAQRLKPAEFGYRSVHYVVRLRPGVFPTGDVDVEIPEETLGLKAEIQVKTILEHAWAVFTHDRAYKGAFKIPEKWQRELSALAGMLEQTDNSFARIQSALQRYSATYGAYMTKETMREEIDLLEIILEHDAGNADLAARIGKLAITLDDFEKAISVLKRYAESGNHAILRDLGMAMCKLHKANPGSDEYRNGQKYLEAAAAPPNKDPDALASLAGTWKGIDDEKARELYRQAFELDPSDPYPLGNYLECELLRRADVAMVGLLRPAIDSAIARCHDQADVGMNLPWAFYDIGKFYLLLGMPYESLAAYARAVQLSTAAFMIETSLRSLDRLAVFGDKLQGYEWARRLLLLGQAIKFPSKESLERLKALASKAASTITGPVIVLVGGVNSGSEQETQGYRQLLLDAFRGFNGTVVSRLNADGGEPALVDIYKEHGTGITMIGYVPADESPGILSDKSPVEMRHSDGTGYSPLEALQYWTDIVTSDIKPSSVKVLGIGGGSIAAAEYRIALALGAVVGIVEGSGGEAARLPVDDEWRTASSLLPLPVDTMTARTFIGSRSQAVERTIRENIAKAIHENYRRVRCDSMAGQDPAMADWGKLASDLRDSNLQQADHVFEKLQRIGCTVHRVTDRNIAVMTFTSDEVELMAEMEHARWNVERLSKGWKLGQERDVTKKISPYLVPWTKLSEDVKKWDRETVRNIPEFLAKVGLDIRRQT
ncbi:MAG: RyR domain-containing protein [Candidatus Eisenbacteria bacterium]|nr:RyR domain-containing protein [Candidatus Eisenbacteria bacterium]